jgi:hypothetical protein
MSVVVRTFIAAHLTLAGTLTVAAFAEESPRRMVKAVRRVLSFPRRLAMSIPFYLQSASRISLAGTPSVLRLVGELRSRLGPARHALRDAVLGLDGQVATRARSAWLAARERAARRARLRALQSLDAATLRDLGLAHSEVASLHAEIEGRAEATRMRALFGGGST